MVYNSWLAMQAAGETDANTCAYNDFALVKLDPADVAKVDPTVPGFGGPTGVGGAAVGATVYSYGNSSLRLGVTQLSPKQGVVVQVAGGGWSRSVYTVTPGIPGDSGSGFLNAYGAGDRRPEHGRRAAAAAVERRRRPRRELGYMRAHTNVPRRAARQRAKPVPGPTSSARSSAADGPGVRGKGAAPDLSQIRTCQQAFRVVFCPPNGPGHPAQAVRAWQTGRCPPPLRGTQDHRRRAMATAS